MAERIPVSRENNRIEARINCLRTDVLPAALISTKGFYCQVWRASRTIARYGIRSHLDLAIKVYNSPCALADVHVLRREHAMLRKRLGSMVPNTVYIATKIDGEPSVVALADAVNRWFDVANPVHESEVIPMIRRLRRARRQLLRFVAAAQQWADREQRVIDLYGLDNLVMDVTHRLRYVDSFGVFFYADLLHAVAEPDESLRKRIAVSRQRLEYLTHVLKESVSKRSLMSLRPRRGAS